MSSTPKPTPKATRNASVGDRARQPDPSASAKPVGRVRALDDPGVPGDPGNRAPSIKPPRTQWMKQLMRWLLEETDEDSPKKPKRDKKSGKGDGPKEGSRSRKPATMGGDAQVAQQNEEAPDTSKGSDGYDHAGEEMSQEEWAAWEAQGWVWNGEDWEWHGDAEEAAEGVAGAGAGDDVGGNQQQEESEPQDWRWFTREFFKSKKRVFVGARFAIMLVLVLSAAWVSAVTVTGFDPIQRMIEPVDPDNPHTWYRAPFFIVESGSMMHPDAPFGRLGTIDPGDIVVIRAVESRQDVQTFYGPGDRQVGGARGDVIVFVPAPTRENPFPYPVVHRAVAYLEREIVQIPNPNPVPGGSPTISVPRFTVEEFGVYDARAVTIPELGLYNYQPDRSGFLTRGDNPRTNDLSDQALGVTANPVEVDRVLGRVVVTAPYAGLARIALMGQNPAQLSPDHEWCTFLAGQAPCDNWLVFLVLMYVLVGVPFVITVGVFSHRGVQRWRERKRFEREQHEALERYEQMRRERDQAMEGPDGSTVQAHDALDLLTGKVVPVGPPRRAPRSHTSRRVPGGVRFYDGRS